MPVGSQDAARLANAGASASGLHPQPAHQIRGCLEIKQSFRQCLQPHQRQTADAGLLLSADDTKTAAKLPQGEFNLALLLTFLAAFLAALLPPLLETLAKDLAISRALSQIVESDAAYIAELLQGSTIES